MPPFRVEKYDCVAKGRNGFGVSQNLGIEQKSPWGQAICKQEIPLKGLIAGRWGEMGVG